VLVVTLPLTAVVAGIAVLGLGLAGRWALRRRPGAASVARITGRGDR
jgi:hypothetical protein